MTITFPVWFLLHPAVCLKSDESLQLSICVTYSIPHFAVFDSAAYFFFCLSCLTLFGSFVPTSYLCTLTLCFPLINLSQKWFKLFWLLFFHLLLLSKSIWLYCSIVLHLCIIISISLQHCRSVYFHPVVPFSFFPSLHISLLLPMSKRQSVK